MAPKLWLESVSFTLLSEDERTFGDRAENAAHGLDCVKTRERSISTGQVSRSKVFEVPRMASPFDFVLEHKNIILVALLDFEFSHGLDPDRK